MLSAKFYDKRSNHFDAIQFCIHFTAALAASWINKTIIYDPMDVGMYAGI